jgi:hypothetical protein
MPKALLGAAEIAGAVALYAIPGAGAILGTAMLDGVIASLATSGIAMEAGAIADALTQNRGMGITTRQPAAFRQIIYGEQRCAGVIVYMSTTGSHYDQYNFVIVLAGHEIDSILNLYLDGRQVHWEGSGDGWTAGPGGNYFGGNAGGGDFIGPGGQHYNFDSLVYCEARYGNQSDGDVIGGLTANDPTWAASGGQSPYLGGCAYVYLKVEYDTSMFPSLPEIKFTLRGKNNIYDPRTGTTGFTNNWALIVADVLTDTEFGLGDTGSVNTDQLIAAANVCDESIVCIAGTESQWCCDFHYDTSMAPGDVLQTMMPAAQGRLSRIGGEWYIFPAYWQGPSFSWDERALSGEFDFTPTRKYRDLVNRVNGTYIAANYPYNTAGNLYDANGWYDGAIANNFPFAFQPSNYPQYACDTLHGYASDAFLAEDGGVELPLEVTQQCVLSVSQAQRAAKIALMRNRQQGTYTLPLNVPAWQMQPLDVMQFSFAMNGWSDKLMEITATSFSVIEPGEKDEDGPTVKFTVTAQDTDPTVYEWDPSTEELTPYDVPGNPSVAPYGVQPPTSVTAVSNSTTALVAADGVVTPRILVAWLPPADVTVTQIQLQYQLSGATSWTSAGTVDNSVSSAYIAGVVSGQTYNVQIAALNASGATSDWVSVTGIAVSAPSSATNSYTNSPPFDLTQPTSTSIAVGAVSVTFGGSTVNYAARTLTITAPTTPTWYYVTIADPTQVGESGSPTLTATCQTSDALVGVLGNTYIGAIQALPAGGATQVLPGGWPAPQSFGVGS